MKRQMLLTLCALAVGVAAAQGADGVSPSYEHLKDLEWMIGNWQGSYVAPADVGAIRKGDHVTAYGACRWMFNKTFVVTNFQLEIDGKRMPDTLEIAGWDDEGGKAVQWLYGDLGAGKGEWTELGPEKAALKWWVDGADGKLAGTSYLEKIDEDSHSWQAKEVTLAGKPLPDWPQMTMRRQQGIAPGDLWTAYRDATAGNWLGKGNLGRDVDDVGLKKGDEFVFHLEWKPDLDGNVLRGNGKFEIAARDHTADVRSVLYWDPATEQVRLLANWSSGNVEELLIRKQVKGGFTGTYVANFIGQGIQRSRLRIEFPDADTIVLKFTSGLRKGEVLSKWKRQ